MSVVSNVSRSTVSPLAVPSSFRDQMYVSFSLRGNVGAFGKSKSPRSVSRVS